MLAINIRFDSKPGMIETFLIAKISLNFPKVGDFKKIRLRCQYSLNSTINEKNVCAHFRILPYYSS